MKEEVAQNQTPPAAAKPETTSAPHAQGQAETPAETHPGTGTTDDLDTPPPPTVTQPAKDTAAALDVPREAVPKKKESKPAREEQKPPPAAVRKAPKAVAEGKPPVRTPVAAASEPAARLGTFQDVFIQSNPSGVSAVLDNRADTVCETPCVMLASPGPHILSLTLPNYQKEIRQIRVADSRLDVPLITMHPDGGTLMISTVPQGANIFVDERLMGSLTPAQILLPGGTYKIKVELNQMRKTETVQIANGNTKYLKIILNP